MARYVYVAMSSPPESGRVQSLVHRRPHPGDARARVCGGARRQFINESGVGSRSSQLYDLTATEVGTEPLSIR